MTTFDLDAAITTWRQFLRNERSISTEDLDELECHVRDHVDESIQAGIDTEKAFQNALHLLGGYTQLQQEYKQVYWRKLIDQRSWRAELRWRLDIMASYARSAFRSMWKYKAYTFINVLGLSIGIFACFLIVLFTQFELSFDRFHDNAHRIVRIAEDLKTDEQMLYQDTSSPPMGPAFVREFPEVESMVRIRFTDRLFEHEGQYFQEDRLFYADSTLFDIFTMPMLEGNPQKALAEPFSVVLTETTAQKYVGNGEAIGQVLTDEFGTAYTVTGVVEDPKPNSHIQFAALLSMVSRNAWDGDWESQWFANSHFTYLLLREGTDVAALEAKTPDFIERTIGDLQRQLGTGYINLPLIPLTEIHMSSHRARGYGTRISRLELYVFSAIAVFLMLIACINFMNLATARSLDRAKEVGLRKVVGANTTQLMLQFLCEAFLITGFAVGAALLLCWAVLPTVNSFVDRSLQVHTLFEGTNALILLGTWVLVSLISGSYPALALSKYRPIRVLKGSLGSAGEGVFLRKGLVIFQFAISIFLIVATAVVMKQYSFLQKQDLGFSSDSVVVIDFRGDQNVIDRADTVKERFLSQSSVIAASMSRNVPGGGRGNLYSNIEVAPGDIRNGSLNYYFVDFDFIDLFKMEFVAGRNFSRAFLSDTLESMIINEAMVKRFGWSTPEEALGKVFTTMERDMKVIGVVKDFNYSSLHASIEPLGMFILPNAYQQLALRVSAENMDQVYGELEAIWNDLVPGRPFDAFFLDQYLLRQYQGERSFSILFRFCAGLAIFIACLGLFGLTAFTAGRRTREVGVRKVLGASLVQVLLLLSKDYMRLILVAFLLAVPASYFAMSSWLSEFPYRSDLDVWVFILAGLIALAIAALTVSYQTLRVAMANPIQAIRYE